MTTAYATCNALTKKGQRMLICQLGLHHDGKHKDGDIEWEDTPW